MIHKRQKQIEAIALTTLHNAKGAYRIPVDLNRVADLLGIDILHHDFGEDITSCILVNDKKTVIGVTTDKNYASRRRWIIAHALGHLVLGHQRNRSKQLDNLIIDFVKNLYTMFDFVRQDDIDLQHWTEEREANAFAAGLLIPQPLLLSAISSVSVSFNTKDQKADLVAELAKLFDVPNDFLTFRLATLKTLW